MQISSRRYDIDWVRVIAIGLLLIYHVAIGFQSWGIMIGFITNSKPWPSLWVPMTMLNVWRIPLLFFVSGMGVYFAIQNRNFGQLILERARRILVPFIFGAVAIVPIHVYLWQTYFNFKTKYTPHPGHLWFLGNIFIYVLLLSPLFIYLKRNADGKTAVMIKKTFSRPVGLLVVLGALLLEVWLVNPVPFELYASTWHGYALGFTAFLSGFLLVFSGNEFWQMILKWRWAFVLIAAGLFSYRVNQTQFAHGYLLMTESFAWILSVFAFAFKHLNRPGKTLDYLSRAAYPVYILHMAFLYAASLLIFPLEMNVQIKFTAILLFTVAGCFAGYEIIRRIKFLRPIFGLSMTARPTKAELKLQTSQAK